MAICSCDDTTDTLGMSLTSNTNNVSVSADSFFVESHSIKAGDIVSRSSDGYTGHIKDPETGSYVTCNYMTQFTTMGDYQFPSIDNLVVADYDESQPKADQVKADSCKLILYFSGFYGDSLALMKVMAHEMSKPYEEGVTYKTGFNPISEGMIRNGNGSIHEELSYTISNRIYSDALRGSTSYTPNIVFNLNEEYTDKDGVTYDNYGTYLMKKFYNSDTNGAFTNGYQFTHEICPGFYLENIGGIGALGTIETSRILVYFRSLVNGKEETGISSFAGSEEVLRKTTIMQDEDAIDRLVNEESCTYLKTPAGIFTELTLPIDRIILGRDNDATSHENDTLNTVRLFIPRVNDTSTSDYKLQMPSTLLLLPTDSVENFFANKKLADSRSSYITSYSSSTNGYTFANISQLVTKTYKALGDTIQQVIDAKKREAGVSELSAEQEKIIKKEVAKKYISNHPTWNRVTVIPVETTYSTLSSGSSILTKVTYDMKLRSTKLKKGSNTNGNIMLNVIYSKFKD